MEATEGSRRKTVHALVIALMFVVVALGAMAAGLRSWLPPLASEHGAGIDRMVNFLLVTVGAMFLAGHIALAWFIWRGSRRGQVSFRLPSKWAERIWLAVPIVLMSLVAEGGVLVLGLPVWDTFYRREPPPDSVLVEIFAQQFAWNVRYGGADNTFGPTDPRRIRDDNPIGLDKSHPASRDDIVQLGLVQLPVNRPVHVRLRSRDTLHSAFLPHLRVKQDAVPGMTIEFWFVPTRVGEYEIACAELCGLGHNQMRGIVQVVSAEEFERWLAEQPKVEDTL